MINAFDLQFTTDISISQGNILMPLQTVYDRFNGIFVSMRALPPKASIASLHIPAEEMASIIWQEFRQVSQASLRV